MRASYAKRADGRQDFAQLKERREQRARNRESVKDGTHEAPPAHDGEPNESQNA
jgi:hypothetical protein